jgi:hypothetical protein
MLVEAIWAAAKAPGPLRSFFLRIRARRGHQIAAVAVARKVFVLCWHLLSKDADYQWARPALVASKIRAMRLQAGSRREKAISVARPMPTTSRNYAIGRSMSRVTLSRWQPRRPEKRRTGAANEERR